jgi:hypothetical protein
MPLGAKLCPLGSFMPLGGQVHAFSYTCAPPLCVCALASFKPLEAHICSLGIQLCPLGHFYVLDIQRILIHFPSNSLSLISFSSWLRNFIGIRGTMGSYKYPPTISISSSISSSSYPTQYPHWQYSVESDNSRTTGLVGIYTGLVGIYPSLVGTKPSLVGTKSSFKFKSLGKISSKKGIKGVVSSNSSLGVYDTLPGSLESEPSWKRA